MVGAGAPRTKYKAYLFQIYINHIVYSQYYTNYKKDFRFGVRIRSVKGTPKTARITNLVTLGSEDALHAGRVKYAVRDILDDLNKHGGYDSEYGKLSIKQAMYKGRTRAEILRNEKEYIAKRVREIEESD
jgi:hypothetical protein